MFEMMIRAFAVDERWKAMASEAEGTGGYRLDFGDDRRADLVMQVVGDDEVRVQLGLWQGETCVHLWSNEEELLYLAESVRRGLADREAAEALNGAFGEGLNWAELRNKDAAALGAKLLYEWLEAAQWDPEAVESDHLTVSAEMMTDLKGWVERQLGLPTLG